MPALTYQTLDKTDQTSLTLTTLDNSDTFTYKAVDSVLLMSNTSGASITFTMEGDGAPATKFLSGVGNVAVSPVSVTVANGAYEMLPLRFYDEVLSGVVTITTGGGLDVALIEY